MAGDTPGNRGVRSAADAAGRVEWPDSQEAERRVLRIQSKFHDWAAADAGRVFDDLYNLVADPAFLAVAWRRVRSNKGARTAGIDGWTAPGIEASAGGVIGFLSRIRTDLKNRTFVPLPVGERMIPKTNGKLRRLGIPTARDRVVQAALKLVLEPIFEPGLELLDCGLASRSAGPGTPSRTSSTTPGRATSGSSRPISQRASSGTAPHGPDEPGAPTHPAINGFFA